MKNRHMIAVGIMLMLPLALQAQENIKKAFDTLVKDDKAKVSASHKLNRDPETGKKEGQLDVYEFTIPYFKNLLVKNIENAFDKDSGKAYTVSSGDIGKSFFDYKSLAVGGESLPYEIGEMKNSKYIYALFLDPIDKEKKYRYAYAMEWKEGEGEIKGKLVVTYATTTKFRDQQNKRNTLNSLKIPSGVNSININGKGLDFSMDQIRRGAHVWLGGFQLFKKWFLTSEGERKNAVALQIYEHCKDVKCLNAEEKKQVIGEIQDLKKNTKDELTLKMFDMSIEQLKK